METKEMFKELGYEYCYDDGYDVYTKKENEGIEPNYISFGRFEKEIYIQRLDESGTIISIELLKAIVKKVSELGWKM